MDWKAYSIEIQPIAFHIWANGWQEYEPRWRNHWKIDDHPLLDQSRKEDKRKLLFAPMEGQLLYLVPDLENVVWLVSLIFIAEFKKIKVRDIFWKNTGQDIIYEELVRFV